MKAKVVIGSNFGDEGKGLFIDFLASKYNSDVMVVRFNGGAQAGHTVVTPEGERHVFKHFCAGTFTGATTVLSEFFVSNPMAYIRELKELSEYKPRLCVSEKSQITTPYDIIINQIIETERGKNRHGSCGVGFGETLERKENGYSLTVRKASETKNIKKILTEIKNKWVPKRLAQLNIKKIPTFYANLLENDNIIENFINDCEFFVDNSFVFGDILPHCISKNVIFEGAQGLLLDEKHNYFPHVTRSSTGIKNVSYIAKKFGINEMDVLYITRPYLTRHGVGQLNNELKEKPTQKITDKTNEPNEYQGALRFAHLDLSFLKETIESDLNNNNGIKINVNLGVSCLDQMEEKITFYRNSKKETKTELGFINELSNLFNVKYTSYGETREDIN